MVEDANNPTLVNNQESGQEGQQNMDGVDEEILHISFNQEQDAFAVGTNLGFYIFSIEPF